MGDGVADRRGGCLAFRSQSRSPGSTRRATRGSRAIQRAEGIPRPTVHGLRRYADIAIIGLLLVAVAVLLVRQSDLAGPDSASPAIAVLPFQNLSTAAEGEVLALGIAESVLHQLANLPKLEVISRTSSFAFGNKQQDAREIGKQLGARFLLEGSVQSDRARMRVTTQLIDTQTGADVWSMRFDRAPGDIFEVQDEIALQVTRALELSLDAKERDRLTGQGTENLDAYLAFLQGRSLQATDRVADTRDAVGHFERATRRTRSLPTPMSALPMPSCSSRSTKSPTTGPSASRPRCARGASWSSARLPSIPRTATRICSAHT